MSPTPSSIVGHVRPVPTPSRSAATASGRHSAAPGSAGARGDVAITARLWRLQELRRVAGPPGVAAIAGGAAGEACGGPSARRSVVLATSFRAALQAVAFLVEDLEEQHRGAIILEVDHEGTLRTANSGNLAPAPGHEDLPGGISSNLHSSRWGVAVGMLQPLFTKAPRRHPSGEVRWEAYPGARGNRRHSTNSREESTTWTPRMTACASAA